MAEERRVRSVAIIGAGAAGKSSICERTTTSLVYANNLVIGAVTAAAFVAEKNFDRIQVFERRESAGGTW